jgi:hypothetical protein
MQNEYKNTSKIILKEILKEFVNLIFGNVFNKIGLSLLCFIISLTFFFAKMENDITKPLILKLFGVGFILISLTLILMRYSEIKNKKNKPN